MKFGLAVDPDYYAVPERALLCEIILFVSLLKGSGCKGQFAVIRKDCCALSPNLFLSPPLSPVALSESLYAQTRPKAPNFIGVIKRRFIRLRSGEGKTEDARASHACAYMGFLFLLPLFLISAAAMNAA